MTPGPEQIKRPTAAAAAEMAQAFRWRLLPRLTPLVHRHRVILGPELLALVRRRRAAQVEGGRQ